MKRVLSVVILGVAAVPALFADVKTTETTTTKFGWER